MRNLLVNLDNYLKEVENKEMSQVQLLKFIFKKEYEYKVERARVSRITRGKIPTKYSIETYPFAKQKHLNKKRLLERYDSMDYILQQRNMIFMGPTGSGKTGLATSFLIHAINNGYTGKFIVFHDLMDELHKSQADDSSKYLINRYAKIDCLLIDELGYLEASKSQVGLFFSLMQQRYKKCCTLLTTNLGFKEWNDFLQNKHLTAALIDRLTDNGHVINMKNCKSIRKDPDVD